MWFLVLVVLLAAVLALLYVGRGWLAWVLPGAALLLTWAWAGGAGSVAFWVVAVAFFAVAALTGVSSLRRSVVSPLAMRAIAPILPRMSETERAALEAGTVWWDAELFSGAPHWQKLLDFHPTDLTERERAFLDGTVPHAGRPQDPA
jgi:acyl-CoA dehydrogenase